MYEFWNDHVKPKYGEKSKLCYMDNDSFIVYTKIEYIYINIAKYVETILGTSNYELERPLPKGTIKKVVGLVKYKLGGKFMTEFSALKPKPYRYLTDNNNRNKKAKGTKKCVIKRKLLFEDYKYCLEPTQLENKINQIRK